MNSQSLSSVIRDSRKRQGLSVSELARRLEISKAFVSEIENGNKYPSPAVLLKISKLLKLDVERLMALDDRVPYDELRQLANRCPALGEALRDLVKQAKTGTPLQLLADRIASAVEKCGT
ncbi:MAG: helix-turn-helix domain-containing protein [Limisphaerales bacterium]